MKRTALALVLLLAGPAAAVEVPFPPVRPDTDAAPVLPAVETPPRADRPAPDAATGLAPDSSAEPARRSLPDAAVPAERPVATATPVPAVRTDMGAEKPKTAAAEPLRDAAPAATDDPAPDAAPRQRDDPRPAAPLPAETASESKTAADDDTAEPRRLTATPPATGHDAPHEPPHEAPREAPRETPTEPTPAPRRDAIPDAAPDDGRAPVARHTAAPDDARAPAPRHTATPAIEPEPAGEESPIAPPMPRQKPVDRSLRTAMLSTDRADPERADRGGATICGDPRLAGRIKPTVAGRYPGCLIIDPVEVSAIAGIRLSMPVTLGCPAARTFANWITGVADPAARQILGARIKRVFVMGSYACRTRNSQRGKRLSQHAVGRAVDIGGFTLGNGRQIRVESDWRSGAPGKFLRHVWKRGCGMFKTVLGPDGDRFHQNHLHLDVAQRNSTYCR